MVQGCNSVTCEAEAGRSLVQGWPGLCSQFQAMANYRLWRRLGQVGGAPQDLCEKLEAGVPTSVILAPGAKQDISGARWPQIGELSERSCFQKQDGELTEKDAQCQPLDSTHTHTHRQISLKDTQSVEAL